MGPNWHLIYIYNVQCFHPDTATLSVPKLHDDRSNWSDYEPQIQRALGAKDLWIHIKGMAIAPKPYQLVNSIPVLSGSKTLAFDDQIEAREMRINNYDKLKYLAQHVILSTTSTCISSMIKYMKIANEMWENVKLHATTKSMLYLIDVEDQLASIM